LELNVFTSNATRALIDALAVMFERSSGMRVVVVSDSASVLLDRIRHGETADVAVLNAPHIDELVQLTRIVPASRRLFARSRIGVAVRSGTRHPKIDTVEALTRTLLDAQTVAHTIHGASGMHVPKILERLGIADRVRTVTRPGGLIAKVVAAGEAEIAVQQISELLAVDGVELVGPLPDPVQITFESAAGIFTESKQPERAQALLQFFSEPACASVFAAKGLEPA